MSTLKQNAHMAGAYVFAFMPSVFYALYYLTDQRYPHWYSRIGNGLIAGVFFQFAFLIASAVLTWGTLRLGQWYLKEKSPPFELGGSTMMSIQSSCLLAMVCYKHGLPFGLT